MVRQSTGKDQSARKEKRIAVIPARGGSKRIANKNIIDFCGKPMLAWTIEAAQRSGLFQRIMVSSDSQEILDVARNYGVETPFRREQAADDQTPVSVATVVALQQAQHHWQEQYQQVVQLMPNCPLRGAEEIIAAVRSFEQMQASFQISCFAYGWMNPWWAMTLDTENSPTPLFPEMLKRRSQDLPKLYCPTGAIWIAETEALVRENTFYGEGYRLFPLAWQAAVDIDDQQDLEMARAINAIRLQHSTS